MILFEAEKTHDTNDPNNNPFQTPLVSNSNRQNVSEWDKNLCVDEGFPLYLEKDQQQLFTFDLNFNNDADDNGDEGINNNFFLTPPSPKTRRQENRYRDAILQSHISRSHAVTFYGNTNGSSAFHRYRSQDRSVPLQYIHMIEHHDSSSLTRRL
eukprot:CAMPEP_0172523602 /NCGR_PEP_ID=MMETSP1066-20121228/293747_1 /TAXON_ID=671091 /ORGANISM="Coscinodiscus wailesii, Strain CCMP2513" /LENGTH=153 /DNA_ID=CAMNT_0013306683 /DNA_START=16 /DNA_END=477 /DNA_ORIENTATION=+